MLVKYMDYRLSLADEIVNLSIVCITRPVPFVLKSGMSALTEILAPHITITRRMVPFWIREQTAFKVGLPSSTALTRVPSSSFGGCWLKKRATVD